jgi:hypothetical protein
MIRLAIALRAGLLVGLLGGLALAPSALADPAKVLVLPLGGDADPNVRAKYSAAVQRLARTLGGKVTPGDVTFTDTATAIGCDPKAPRCAEDVRATLGVDELIYGTVSRQNGKLALSVHRVAKGKPPRDAAATFEVTDPPERAEPELAALFRPAPAASGGTEGAPSSGEPGAGAATGDPGAGPAAGTDPGADPGAGAGAGPAERPAGPPVSRNKVLGYTAVGGGATLLLISFALWSSASGLEDDISSHPVTDRSDFTALRDLEDTARTRAWTGNALFLLGLAAGGLGGWILYREHKAQRTVVTPVPTPGGAGAALVLGGVF